MAHEMSLRKDGTGEALFADNPAWHGLGELIRGVFSAAEGMAKALPWDALDIPLFAHAPAQSPHAHLAEQWGSKFYRTNNKGIFRSDTGALIGTVGEHYEPIQPKTVFNYVDTLIEGSGYHYESAGALRGGSVIFVTARVGQIDVLGSGDITKTYLAFVNSFDGSLAAQVYLTGTRIVCMNTLQISLGNAQNTLRFRHTKNVHARMDAAQALVTGVQATEADLKQKLETLAQRKVTRRATYTAILDSLFPGESTKTSNIKRDITDLWSDNDHNAFPDWQGTAYSLYNAVTRYVDHERSTRGDDKRTSRYESAILGTGAALKAKALEKILVLTDGQEESTSIPSLGIPDSVETFLGGIETIATDED